MKLDLDRPEANKLHAARIRTNLVRQAAFSVVLQILFAPLLWIDLTRMRAGEWESNVGYRHLFSLHLSIGGARIRLPVV